MYQLINERRTNHYNLPKNYTIVAAANPTDGYETYEFDKALINRFAWIDFQPSAKESATYLAQKYPNSIFAPWILMNEEMLEISPSQTNSAFDNSMDDKKSFSPRIVENLMILSIVLEERGEKTSFKNKVYRAIAPKGKVDAMLQWDAEAKNLISVDDVLSGKGKEEVDSYIKKQRMDLISVLTQRLSQFFTSYEFSVPRTAKEDAMVKNLFDFLHAVPREMAFVFINGVTTQYYETKDGKRYEKQQEGSSLKINEHSLLTQPEFTAVGKEKYDFYMVKNMHQLFLQVTKEGAKDTTETFENMLSDIDILVEGVYRDRTDRANFHKQFLTFGIALYGMVALIQLLIGQETYISMIDNTLIRILIHGIVIINSYFLLSGEKYYNENVGAE